MLKRAFSAFRINNYIIVAEEYLYFSVVNTQVQPNLFHSNEQALENKSSTSNLTQPACRISLINSKALTCSYSTLISTFKCIQLYSSRYISSTESKLAQPTNSVDSIGNLNRNRINRWMEGIHVLIYIES